MRHPERLALHFRGAGGPGLRRCGSTRPTPPPSEASPSPAPWRSWSPRRSPPRPSSGRALGLHRGSLRPRTWGSQIFAPLCSHILSSHHAPRWRANPVRGPWSGPVYRLRTVRTTRAVRRREADEAKRSDRQGRLRSNPNRVLAPVTAWGIAAVRRQRSARPQCGQIAVVPGRRGEWVKSTQASIRPSA